MAELEEKSARPLVLIAGMLTSKDPTGFFVPFAGLAREAVVVPIPDTEAAFEPTELAAHAARAGLTVRVEPGVEEALRGLSRQEGPLRILICGSLYLAGHVLRLQEAVLE